MSTKSLVFAGAALVAGAAAALPASAAPNLKQADGLMGPAVMFNLLDRNGDGVIDKDEASALTNAVFAALDTDHSGTLTEQELRGALNHLRMNRAAGRGSAQREFQRGPDGRGWNDDGRFGPRMAERGPDGRGWNDGRFGPHMAERGPLMRHPGVMGGGPNGPNTAQGQGPGPNVGQGPGPNMGQGPGPNAPQGPGPNMGQGPGPNAPQGPGPNAGQGGDQTAQNNVRTRMFDYLDTNHDGVISKDEFDAARFPHMDFWRNR